MLKKLLQKGKERINNLTERLKRPLVRIFKRTYLPGFEGLPLYDVAVFFMRSLRNSSLYLRASSISFDFVMAVPATLLFFFSLIPQLPIPDLHDTVMETLRSGLPENAYLTVRSTIEDIISRSQRELLSIGFLLSIFFSSNGMISVMKTFNQSVLVTETRGGFHIRLVSILLVIIVALIVIISAALQIASYSLLDYLAGVIKVAPWMFKVLFFMAKYIIYIALLFSVFSFVYYLAPAKRGTYKFVSPGSTLATLLTIATLELFSYFINNFGQYNRIYGSIGTVLVILLLINFTALILLVGFELNASIHTAKKNNLQSEEQKEQSA